MAIDQIVTLALALLLARWLARGIYRVYFHPLSRFPGPKFSAFTRMPHLYTIYSGSLYKYVKRLHEEYGDVVRISPDELSFLNPDAWRDIYGHGSKVGQGSPPPKHFQRYGKDPSGIESIVNTHDDAKHGQIRRIFSPAFSDRALTQQAPLFQRYVDQLVQVLKDGIKQSNGEKQFDMVKMYNFTTFDIMGDLAFGESLHMLDSGKYDAWVTMVFQSVKLGTRMNILQGYYPLASAVMDTLMQKLFAKQIEVFNSHAVTRVTKRLEKGRDSEGVDIWDLVLGQQDKGKEGLSRKQMDVNASLFMLAGTETTATLLSGLTYFLLKNPVSMEKLTKEIRSAFSSSKDISMEAIAKLPYLNACIKEGLRRYPPLPVGLPHLTPANGSTICGQYVPPEMTVAAHHLVVYSSPKVFKDPLSFIPERWMGEEKYAADDRSALQPFSVGSRDCLGKNMAYHEMRLILAKVVYNFDLDLCPGNDEWLDQEVYVLWEKKPLLVNVKMRVTA
ncbi:Nn.00g037180.m01.CDS01 [Neocucurbitaria sp. VM-36]